MVASIEKDHESSPTKRNKSQEELACSYDTVSEYSNLSKLQVVVSGS